MPLPVVVSPHKNSVVRIIIFPAGECFTLPTLFVPYTSKAFYFAVGLRSVGSCIAMFNMVLRQSFLKLMLGAPSFVMTSKFLAIISKYRLEYDVKF